MLKKVGIFALVAVSLVACKQEDKKAAVNPLFNQVGQQQRAQTALKAQENADANAINQINSQAGLVGNPAGTRQIEENMGAKNSDNLVPKEYRECYKKFLEEKKSASYYGNFAFAAVVKDVANAPYFIHFESVSNDDASISRVISFETDDKDEYNYTCTYGSAGDLETISYHDERGDSEITVSQD